MFLSLSSIASVLLSEENSTSPLEQFAIFPLALFYPWASLFLPGTEYNRRVGG